GSQYAGKHAQRPNQQDVRPHDGNRHRRGRSGPATYRCRARRTGDAPGRGCTDRGGVLPSRAAARHLTPADGLKGLAPLARVFGCDGELLTLDATRARSLGAPPRSRLALVPGPGDRRLLLAALPRGAPLRESVAKLANSLAREAPHLQWALAAHVRDDPALVIAACAPDSAGARLAALTVDRARIVDSDVEAVRLLNDASAASGTLAHTRWLEVL